jgi:hypothetical protein
VWRFVVRLASILLWRTASMVFLSEVVRRIFLLLIILSWAGCGGGSGGESSNPIGTASPTTVTGSITAPGGAFAFNRQSSFGELFGSDAYAALTGLVPVPDGTIVQLGRFNATGTSVTPITTTTTMGGLYSFNLTALGVQPSHDLIVQVTGASGKKMRSFVVGTIADINPVSEAACQLIVQTLGTRTLDNFSLQEVSDIVGAIGLTALTLNIGNAVSVDQAVTLVKTAVAANASITAFIAAAAQPGVTSEGTSDVGNFFPFDQGSIWRYHGIIPLAYDTTVLVSGQGPAPINGVNSTISLETNPEGSNQAEKSYGVKDNSGITSYGTDDPNDNITPQLVPYTAIHFPLTPGTTFVLVNRSGLNWGSDLDGDGISESFNFNFSQRVIGTESVTVPAGTFPNSVRIEFTAVAVLTGSRGGQGSATQKDTVWYVAGVGKVKAVETIATNGGAPATILNEELEGYVVNGQGSGLRIEVKPAPVSMRVGEDKSLQATAFDMSNTQVVGLPFIWLSSAPAVVTVRQDGTLSGIEKGTATVTASLGALKSNSVSVTVSDVKVLQLGINDLAYDSVSRKLYASMPGTQGRIATIDPVTGLVTQSPVVGDEPDRLAISDDGQFLYVSIDNENAVRRLTLPALTTDLTFPLTNMAPVTLPGEYLCGKDMKVVPGNARTVVVAIARHPIASGNCAFNEPDGAAVYQDGTMLPNTTTGFPFVHRLEFSNSPSLLFGLGTFSPASLTRISVTASGLSVIDFNTLTNGAGRDFKFFNGLIYTASGNVIDGTTYSGIGSFTNAGVFSLHVDGGSKRIFAVTGLGFDDTVATVQAFDLNTLTLNGALDIPNLGIPAIPQFPRYTSLVRWGSDGLAFRTSSNQVVILRSPLVGP